MLAEVRKTIARHRLLLPAEPVWAAVSGGIDSMVLLHVLRALGHPCSAVHVDHGLRGEESDGDRQFVEDHCRREGVELRVVRVDPRALASAPGVSMQMAARELRYAQFRSIMSEQGRTVALGHHRDDAVESLLIHLMRGAGTKGWSGMPVQGDGFVRPLLGVDRQAILEYAQKEGIPFREDSSNASSKYLRNRVRHELLPLMEQLRPGARRTLGRSSYLLREMEQAAEGRVLEDLGELANEPGALELRFDRLERSAVPTLMLTHVLRHRGAHPDVIEQIADAFAERRTGARFDVGTWCVHVEREALLIQARPDPLASFVIDDGIGVFSAGPFTWSLSNSGSQGPFSGLQEAVLDADRLTFPLQLRPWKAGDRMRPAGLQGSKLISDLLTDGKVPTNEKARAYVLLSGDIVIWLAGHRVSEGVSAHAASKRVLSIRLHPN